MIKKYWFTPLLFLVLQLLFSNIEIPYKNKWLLFKMTMQKQFYTVHLITRLHRQILKKKERSRWVDPHSTRYHYSNVLLITLKKNEIGIGGISLQVEITRMDYFREKKKTAWKCNIKAIKCNNFITYNM